MENLARYRWHTGAPLHAVEEGEPLPVLFRDVGAVGMTRFLSRGLERLAGPLTPLTYLRSAEYLEPYIDYGRIGRLVLLNPAGVQPWHSGIAHIYVASAWRMPSAATLGFVPPNIPLPKAAAALGQVGNLSELREAFGAKEYDQERRDALGRLRELEAENRAVEPFAAKLRLRLQTGDATSRKEIRNWLAGEGLSESDLCAAWHHLPSERRRRLQAFLPKLQCH